MSVVCFACQPAGVPLETWCESGWERERCATQRGCGVAAPDARCEDQLRSIVSPPSSSCTPAMTAALDAGRVIFDGLAAERCETALASSCGLRPDDCGKIVRGLVPIGEACHTFFECADGSYCDNGSTCPGICRASVPVGQEAPSFAACERGVFPEPLSDGGVRCSGLGQEGESCSARPCAPPLACSADDVCRTAVETGGACDRTRPCGAGALCIAGACTPFARRGEPCGPQFPSPMESPPCQLGLACRDGACGDPLRPGEACRFDPAACQGGTWCINDVCTVQGDIGSACTAHSDCARLWCLDGTCTTGRKSGEACGAAGPCADGLSCDAASQRCAPATCGP